MTERFKIDANVSDVVLIQLIAPVYVKHEIFEQLSNHVQIANDITPYAPDGMIRPERVVEIVTDMDRSRSPPYISLIDTT